MEQIEFPVFLLGVVIGALSVLAFYSFFEFVDRAARVPKRWED